MKNFPLFRNILTLTIISGFAGFAQNSDSTRSDSTTIQKKVDFVTKMQDFARQAAIDSKKDFAADKAVIEQNRIFEQTKATMQKAKSYLRTSVDSSGTRRQLSAIQQDLTIAADGVLTKKGTAQTFRNLTASAKIIAELLSQANERKAKLDYHQQQLNRFRYQLDSLLSLPSLFKFPTDSADLSKYIAQIKVVNFEIEPIEKALKLSATSTRELLNQVNVQVVTLQTNLEEIERYQRSIAENLFTREFKNIWGKMGFYRPFSEILRQAQAKGELTLAFYLENNSGKLIILLLLSLTSFFYLRSLKKIYIESKLLAPDFKGQLVFKYPWASALLIVINLFQFIFFSPPFILNVIFWTIGCTMLTIMFRNFVTPYWMRVWLLMVLFFILAAFDNLILQASRTERWFMLALSLSGALTGAVVLIKGKREELREKLILVAIGFMVVLELGSMAANITGRYNLAKALLIGGYLNVVVAILFLWTVRVINEGLFLAFNVYTEQRPKLFYLNFDKVGGKVPPVFYVLLVFGWVILFGRNFPGFEYISIPLAEFFGRDRTLGDYTFSINGLLLFVVIMGVAVVVSKIVSFFASDKHLSPNKEDKHAVKGIGSWLLLIRITILSLGLFLAIAAAGIPMDKITIVIGALGLGIGLGLQALVNNLVSGLIIAFEKPVNVGDVVEIDGQAGTMKSIGFRSSVISTWDGADVVMPNGDLLNSHLTNWSLGGNRKRMSITIGVAYDTDLTHTRTLLAEILDSEERILKSPAPVIQYEEFKDSAINLKIFFWTKSLRDTGSVKSDLIIAINSAFKTANIIIPFNQYDVHVLNQNHKNL